MSIHACNYITHVDSSLLPYPCGHVYLLFLELDELSLRMYVKWHYAWARRVVSSGSSQHSAAIDMSGMNEAMTADEYDARIMHT